jgi:signal transduction histidine kinase
MNPGGDTAMAPPISAAESNDLSLDSQRIAGEAAPVHNDQRMLTMYEIAKILATEHDVESMAPRLLACLMNMQEIADTGVLLLYDPTEAALKVEAVQGCDLEALRGLRVSPDELSPDGALRAGRSEIYAGPQVVAAAAARLQAENAALLSSTTDGAGGVSEEHGLYSVICIPLIADQAEVGVLMLQNRHRLRSFTPEDLTLLEPVANLLALSISNARLRTELAEVQSLSEANRLKAEVISTLAHEMRTPLTSIKGYATALLMEEASFSPQTQREFLQIIDEECDVLQDLIHDLLESSIIDAGFLKLDLQPVLVPRLASAIVDEFVHLSPQHRFMVDFPSPFPIVDADPQRITQVLRNLLDNAVKYSPNGGLVMVRGEVGETEVVLSVADQGEGIAPEHLNRLFEKFFRIKSGLGRHVVGTGLGLPIARTIVETHGGRIWAESQLGQGTTFYFTIPCAHTTPVLGELEGGLGDVPRGRDE